MRIERATGRAVVSMRERGRAPAGDARLLGYLLDASAIAQRVQALLVELPRGADDLAMRVRVEASDDLAKWAPLVSDAPLLRLAAGGQRLEIAVTSDRYWLLRVNQRGGGLGAGAPQLAAGWVAQRLVFAARAPAPFQLVYGSSRAVPAVYPIATLISGCRADDVEGVDRAAAVPIGRASAGGAGILAGEVATRRSLDWQRWTLWASLLLGVALLAWMALRLGRQAAGPPPGAPRQRPPAG